MPYDPARHHRRSIRLKGFDYSLPGHYFVTVCVRHFRCVFGEVVADEMRLNRAGIMVDHAWQALPSRFDTLELHVWQLMPNHFHAIVYILDRGVVGATGRSPLHSVLADKKRPNGPRPKSISSLMAGFQSAVTAKINKIRQTPGAKVWQRNYYDRIIRTEHELHRIREYIVANPTKWAKDRDNPGNNNLSEANQNI